MKKTFKTIMTGMMLLPTTTLALGAGDCPDSISGSGACTGTLETMISTISNTVLLIVGVVAVLFLILGGFQYISSAGNPESVQKAKNTIFYAIIGIVVTLLAYVVVTFVINALTK